MNRGFHLLNAGSRLNALSSRAFRDCGDQRTCFGRQTPPRLFLELPRRKSLSLHSFRHDPTEPAKSRRAG